MRSLQWFPKTDWYDNAGVPRGDEGEADARSSSQDVPPPPTSRSRLVVGQPALGGAAAPAPLRVCVQKRTEHDRMALRTGTVFGLPWIAQGIGWVIGAFAAVVCKGFCGVFGKLNTQTAQAIDIRTWARKVGHAFNFAMAALTIIGLVPLLLDKVDGRNKAALLSGAATLGLSWVAHFLGWCVGGVVGFFAQFAGAAAPVDKRKVAAKVKGVGYYAKEFGYMFNWAASFISPVGWLVLWKGRKHLMGRPAPLASAPAA